MYRKPGVYVTQEYLASVKPARNIENYLPALFGTIAQVVEGEDAYFGIRARKLTAGSFTSYALPVKEHFAIDYSTLRVFIIPTSGTSMNIKSVSKKVYEDFGLKYTIPADYIDITEWLKTKTVTVDSNTITCVEDGRQTVYIPEEIKFTNDEMSLIQASPNIVFETVSETITDPGTGSTTTVDYSIPKGFDYVRVFIEFVAYPTEDNPILGYPQKVSSISQIEDVLGKIHPMNRLAFGAYLAFISNGGLLPVIATPIKQSAIDPLEPDTDALTDAILRVGVSPNVYALAPLADAANPTVINSTIQAINEAYSENYMRQFRVAMLGFKNIESAFGTNTNDKSAVKTYLNNIIAPLEEKRLRICMNPAFRINYNGLNYPVPGYMYGAFYAGQVAGLMNELTGKPSEILTETEVPVFNDIIYPNFLRYYFSEMDLNEIAAMGYWILYKDEDEKIKVRHQITTANLDVATLEDSIIRSVDYVSNSLKSTLKDFVARIVLTEDNINNVIKPAIEKKLELFKIAGIVGNNTRLVELVVSEESPDTLIANVRLQIVFPLNYVDLKVVAGAQV